MENTLTVSQLIGYINQDLDLKYRKILLIGEISSFKSWRSGHWYFDLKDQQALISGVMFKNSCNKLQVKPSDGLRVLVTGKLNIYATQSKIQVIVEKIEFIGAGDLALAFNKLKSKLEKEGLFQEIHKKKLPFLPERIGLVTSPQGSVLQDMVRILNTQMPGINVILAPVRVQGFGSANEIASAITQLDEGNHCDVIIIGRGGGSIDDLWAFNDEIVARAIFSCTTPVISAIGHETDFTIADLVADIRCATPTHAAQIAVPNKIDLLEKCILIKIHFNKLMNLIISKNQFKLANVSKKLISPKLRLCQFGQNLEFLTQKLKNIMLNYLRKLKDKLILINHKLNRIFNETFYKVRERYFILIAKLKSLSPLNVLTRGYGVIYFNEKPISTIKSLSVGNNLNLRLIDGKIDVRIKKIYEF